MDPIEEIRLAQAAQLVDEDGNDVVLELEPGLTAAEIDQLWAEVGVPLPLELRTLLQHTSGIDGALESIDFTGRLFAFESEETFPSGSRSRRMASATTGCSTSCPEAASAAVFFACHDAPVVLYQSPDLGHFLHETFRMLQPPHASLVDDVYEDRLFRVWRENPGTLDHAAALAGDEQLREFAAALDDRFTFVDLREPEIGMGFSWGRHGPRTDVRRHGYERLFAYAPPEKKPGLLSRLFG